MDDLPAELSNLRSTKKVVNRPDQSCLHVRCYAPGTNVLSVVHVWQLELARRGQRFRLRGEKLPVPRFPRDRSYKTEARAVPLQPLVNLVRSIKHVMLRVQIKRLPVLVI